MAKKKAKAKVTKTWVSKTKTKKSRRCGMNAAAHHSIQTIRLQTPNDRKRPFIGLTTMRLAFTNVKVASCSAASLKVLMRALRSKSGTYASGGWQVDRRRAA